MQCIKYNCSPFHNCGPFFAFILSTCGCRSICLSIPSTLTSRRICVPVSHPMSETGFAVRYSNAMACTTSVAAPINLLDCPSPRGKVSVSSRPSPEDYGSVLSIGSDKHARIAKGRSGGDVSYNMSKIQLVEHMFFSVIFT